MSQPTVIYWPSYNSGQPTYNNGVNLIAPVQTVSVETGTLLKINSNLPYMPNVSVNNSGVYEFDSIIRSIVIESDNDLSNVHFDITGLSMAVDNNGLPLGPLEVFTETVTGPDNDIGTSQSGRIYKRIDSIRASTVFLEGYDVSVSWGTFGMSSYVFLDYNSSSPQHWALQGQVLDAEDPSDFAYGFFASLTKPEIINTQFGNITPYPNAMPAFPVGPAQADNNYLVSNTTGIGNAIASIVWVVVDSNTDQTASLYFTCVQQGLRS